MPGATTAPIDQLLDPSDWETYRRTSTKLPRRSFSLPFCPPDGPAAVKYLDTPPSIARPSLLRLKVAAGILHWELTPLVRSHHPLACWRPHLHRGVCLCVWVCVCVCNIIIIVFYATPPYLQSRLPPSSLSRLSPSYTPTPRYPLLYANNHLYPVPSPVRCPVSFFRSCTPRFSHVRSQAVTSLLHP